MFQGWWVLWDRSFFGLESSRWAGDLSVTWLMPLAGCWCHFRGSALLRANTKCWEMSLQGNSLFMDLVPNLLLGFCLQRWWTVPKGFMFVQGADTAQHRALILLLNKVQGIKTKIIVDFKFSYITVRYMFYLLLFLCLLCISWVKHLILKLN